MKCILDVTQIGQHFHVIKGEVSNSSPDMEISFSIKKQKENVVQRKYVICSTFYLKNFFSDINASSQSTDRQMAMA